MDNFKGTKGKWFWTDGDRNSDLSVLKSENGEKICDFGNCEDYYPTEGTEPNEYDKKLICKAPEMLEMLIRISNTNDLDITDFMDIKELIREVVKI